MFTKEQADKLLSMGLIKPETHQKIVGVHHFANGTPPGGVPAPAQAPAPAPAIPGLEPAGGVSVAPTPEQEIAKLSSPMPADPTQERIEKEKSILLQAMPGLYANDPQALEHKAQENVLAEKEATLRNVHADKARADDIAQAKMAADLEYNKKAAALGMPLRKIEAPIPGAPEGGAPKPPGAPAGAVQEQMLGLSQLQMPGAKESEEAIKALYGAQAQLGKEQAGILGKTAEQVEKNRVETQKTLDDIYKRSDALRTQLETDQINPNRFWEEKSTGGKISTIIGMLLAGVGAGVTGRENMAVAQLNKAIDRDIEAQKANINKKGTLINLYMDQVKDRRAAESLARSDMMTVAEIKIKQAMAKAQSPQSAAQMQLALAQVQQQKAQFQLQAAERLNFAQAAGLGGRGEGGIPINQLTYSQLTGENAKRLVQVPDKGKAYYATTEKEAEEMRKVEATYADVNAQLDQLKQLSSIFNSLNPAQKARAESIARQVEPKLLELAGINRFSEADKEQMSETFSQPGAWTAAFKANAKTNQLIKDLKNKMEQNRAAKFIPGSYKPVTSFEE